ncbi:MAG: hypothetical protein K2Q06_06360 [Parvularculaceae bacterium]|nr:hypothetical protein [Parvularculaceae bacterium]
MAERSLLPAPLCDAVDFDRVRILRAAHNPYAALLRITVVRGWRIFWPDAPEEARTLPERAHLAHELVHVWQYQALGKTGIEILLHRRYRYALETGKPFRAYGFEQQAAIVEDLVRVSGGAAPRWTPERHAPQHYAALLSDAAFRSA